VRAVDGVNKKISPKTNQVRWKCFKSLSNYVVSPY